MKEERKVDFKKYVSKPVSKWYLIRIAFYIILLSGLIALFFYRKKNPVKNPEAIDSIENVTISID